jgi:hypothetical protein
MTATALTKAYKTTVIGTVVTTEINGKCNVPEAGSCSSSTATAAPSFGGLLYIGRMIPLSALLTVPAAALLRVTTCSAPHRALSAVVIVLRSTVVDEHITQ